MTDKKGQVPVLRCVVSAFVFLRRNIAFLYVTGSLFILANIISAWLSLYFPAASSVGTLSALLSLALIPLMVVLFAAYLRRGLGMPSGGMMGLQFGADEARLFLTMFAVAAITTFIVFLGTLVAIFGLSAVIASTVDPAIIETEPASVFAHSGAIGIAAVTFFGAAVAALGLYTIARFTPAYPAVIAEGRVVVFEAASWSKGQGWRMALALVLTALPFYLLLAPGMVQYAKIIFASYPADGGLENALISTADLRPLLWFFMLSAMLWPAINGAISGLYVTFYRGLRASQDNNHE